MHRILNHPIMFLILPLAGGISIWAALSHQGWGWQVLSLAIIFALFALQEITRCHAQRRAELAADARLAHASTLLAEAEARSESEQQRTQWMVNFTRRLFEAQDEQSLVETALAGLNELTGALGCSFVPVDVWDQPLPPYTQGRLPEPVLRAWAEHLSGTSEGLRRRCASCKVLESSPGRCPMHPQTLGDSLTVYCLPLERASAVPTHSSLTIAAATERRRLGILNLYLPLGKTLDLPMREFIEALLSQIALAVEAVRMREQEIVTLRQLQMVRANTGAGASDALADLLAGLSRALDVEFAWMLLRPAADGKLTNLDLRHGSLPSGFESLAEPWLTRAQAGETLRSSTHETPVWMVLPMRLPEGGIVGALMVGSSRPRSFHPRQEAILQTVAAQAALLVEHNRASHALEYKSVIQERARLAREIHDGLAQTLAFLKLQSAQMQNYLDKGDMARLSITLKENYQTLTDAYLDTRQAIDNLRRQPRAGVADWLERAALDFESMGGVPISRSLAVLPEAWTAALTPELQAQLMRIVQEALNNVRKHAHAHAVELRLSEQQEDLIIEVSDDGVGFDADDVPVISQHGLRGMRERADMIGADFQIISRSQQGTVVHLTLPGYLKEATH